MSRELPRNGDLLAMARKFRTDTALARELSVPRTTLRDHIERLAMREQINVVREVDEAKDPSEIPLVLREYDEKGTGSRHYVYPLGDVHIGAKTHRADMWQRWLEFLESKGNASLLGTGDFLNTAILGSKSDVYEEQFTVGEAKRLLIKQLEPLAAAGKIDALMPGNHEDRITRAIGDCPIKDVADFLAVPYIEAAARVRYQIGSQEYKFYIRHGTGSGQALAGLAKSSRVVPDADVYVTGHTHRQAVTADDAFEFAGGRRKQYFVSSGSFLGYEKYAAQRGYPPSRLGAPRIYLDARRWDIHVSI